MHRGRGRRARPDRPRCSTTRRSRTRSCCARACRGPAGSRRAPCASRPRNRPVNPLCDPRPRRRPRPYARSRRARRRPPSPWPARRSSRSATTRRCATSRARRPRSSTSAARPCPGHHRQPPAPVPRRARRARRRPHGRATLDDVRAQVAEERARCEPHQWVLGYGLDYNVFAESGDQRRPDRRGRRRRPGDPDVHRLPHRAGYAARARARRRRRPAGVLRARGDRRRRGRADRRAARVGGDASSSRVRCRSSPTLSATRYCAEQLRGLPRRDDRRARRWTGRSRRTTSCANSRQRRPRDAPRDAVLDRSPRRSEEVWEACAATATRAAAAGARASRSCSSTASSIREPAGCTSPTARARARSVLARLRQHYRRAVALFARRLPVATHARGDRGVREALNAYREARAPRRACRHRIEHIETIQPHDLPRFAAEGVIASMQAAAHDVARARPVRQLVAAARRGERSRPGVFPTRSLLESGATRHARLRLAGRALRLARGAWPPRSCAARPVHRPRPVRRPGGRRADGAGTATRRSRALTVGDQARLGRVAPGFLADLTVLRRGPRRRARRTT